MHNTSRSDVLPNSHIRYGQLVEHNLSCKLVSYYIEIEPSADDQQCSSSHFVNITKGSSHLLIATNGSLSLTNRLYKPACKSHFSFPRCAIVFCLHFFFKKLWLKTVSFNQSCSFLMSHWNKVSFFSTLKGFHVSKCRHTWGSAQSVNC